MNDWNPRSDGRPVVLHVVDTLSTGGTERTLVALLGRFDRRSVRHVVVTMREAGIGAASLPDDVACCALGLRGASRWAFLRLAQVARAWNATVVHARNTGCWWDATAAALITPGARAVLGFHGFDRVDGLSRRVGRVARWASRRGTRFTSVSVDGARMLRDDLHLPGERITVLRNGADVGRFQPINAEERRAARDRFGLRHDAFVIGAVGSLTPIKRFDLLIDGLAASRVCLENGHLVIAGDGPLRDALHERAGHLGVADRVQFVGALDDVRDVLATCDAFVCCSDREGISNAMLEAMACGVPVITTRVGDHPQIVGDGVEGFTVEPGNVRELAAAVDRMADNAAGRDILGAAARSRVVTWTLDDAVRAYELFYASLFADDGSCSNVGGEASDSSRLVHWPQAI